MRPSSDLVLGVAFALAVCLRISPAAAATIGSDGSSIHAEGDYRLRYETLDPQYRSAYPGRDQALAMRARLRLDVPIRRAVATAEIMDSRATLNDEGSPVYTSTVNTLELIQALVTWNIPPKTTSGSHTFAVGVLTKDVGSRRLIARNRFRNTVNTFAGFDWTWSDDDHHHINAFYLSPLRRLPEDRAALLDNAREPDSIGRDTLLTGIHVEWPVFQNGSRAEVLAVRSSGPETRIPADAWSALTTVGGRLSRAPGADGWDFDIEAALQQGRSKNEDSADILDHDAFFSHWSAGYTFPGASRLRLAMQYDYASGDKDPFDDETQRFDTLYGARRFDFGPTGIYGPFLRTNLEALGLRSTFNPSASMTVELAYQQLRLASATDAWVLAGLRDASGASGRDLGRQLESTLTWKWVPRGLTLQLGLAYLRYGSFPRSAPSASGQTHSAYAFSQVVVEFGGA